MIAKEALNWSFVAHAIGGMLNDEELSPVRIRLPDGMVLEIGAFEKDAHGQWALVTKEAV